MKGDAVPSTTSTQVFRHTYFINLRALLPDAPLGDVTTQPCVITGTPTGMPYIGMVDDGIGVAIAGNGSAAKSSDELGRLGASLFGEAGWDSGLDPSLFTPQFA